MTTLSVSAIGADRPGIVAGLTEALAQQGCNLEDTSMTILRGHFAMTMVVASPVPAEDLARALEPVGETFGLVVDVREISPVESEVEPGEEYVVSVHGADHPGLVHAFSRLFAERGVNIDDLTTHLVGEGEPLYVMTFDVTVPNGTDTDALADALRRTADELGVTASLHPADADLL